MASANSEKTGNPIIVPDDLCSLGQGSAATAGTAAGGLAALYFSWSGLGAIVAGAIEATVGLVLWESGDQLIDCE